MRSWIEVVDSVTDNPESEVVAVHVTNGERFWLDIEDPTNDVIDRLTVVLGLHPLAVEDSKQFGQRGKVHLYSDVAMMVGFGIDRGAPYEVHAYYTPEFVITLRRGPSTTFDRLHADGSVRALLEGDSFLVLHRLITAMHDDFRPFIDQMDVELDALETAVLDEPTDEQLVEISVLKQRAALHRRTMLPGRDLLARVTVFTGLPGGASNNRAYMDDISDELQLIVSDLAAVGDRCVHLISLHASLTSNRQGAASRQLAAVATIFLPITFVVGFFGMNFGALINTFENGWIGFLSFGIGLNVACIVATVWWLRRHGWE